MLTAELNPQANLGSGGSSSTVGIVVAILVVVVIAAVFVIAFFVRRRNKEAATSQMLNDAIPTAQNDLYMAGGAGTGIHYVNDTGPAGDIYYDTAAEAVHYENASSSAAGTAQYANAAFYECAGSVGGLANPCYDTQVPVSSDKAVCAKYVDLSPTSPDESPGYDPSRNEYDGDNSTPYANVFQS